ncbi:hypothetical protein [Actinokineospora globicatena]|uniref:Uncharacterized protein n=1 Tax=Actinokineospora globicatena TaxID=103729 RepID=A0A9W6QJY4_9PSEU|nr:hypothetical protein [Actinokineospora globicatena]GLW91823.1 hypothetical protein Aglo03_26390 [Actinokineospora globicatena]
MTDPLGLLHALHRAAAHTITITPTNLDEGTRWITDSASSTVYISPDLSLIDYWQALAEALAELLPMPVSASRGATAVAPAEEKAVAPRRALRVVPR